MVNYFLNVFKDFEMCHIIENTLIRTIIYKRTTITLNRNTFYIFFNKNNIAKITRLYDITANRIDSLNFLIGALNAKW